MCNYCNEEREEDFLGDGNVDRFTRLNICTDLLACNDSNNTRSRIHGGIPKG